MSNMTTETKTETVETLLTNAPNGCAETAQLYSWATNYDVKVGTPFGVFLDLTGITAEYLSAEPLVKNPNEFMGFLELDMLAKALIEFAERPVDVENFVCSLIVAELGL
jgi:hypothetical protein